MPEQTKKFDTIIIGAGAAGLMCAAHAGRNTLVLEHMPKPGEKIRISGGGRCNFTNLYSGPENFLSLNPHFAKSALSRYTQWDFIDLVARHGIGWHEKTLGQLFCDESSQNIIDMLLAEMHGAGARLWLSTSVDGVKRQDDGFAVFVNRNGLGQTLLARNLVVACGGKSIPKIGASDLGYRIARQFDHAVTETRPGLVPLTFGAEARFSAMSGLACPARVVAGGAGFDEALLFTHRGLSGPAILQASSYWREGEEIAVTLLPQSDILGHLRTTRSAAGRKEVATVLAEVMPKRLAQFFAERAGVDGRLADQSDACLEHLVAQLVDWRLKPTGSEGYRKAEVTLGGVDTNGLNSRTMESRTVPGLFFIGEVVDVAGWLGGYNFQWAWSSGWSAGQAITASISDRRGP
ncbi:NAD(P)/FAD-dependent oxidoreductase [Tropicimonas sp. S265A]|uniref:NAD(P)/FAD-dependent oxidoreductase n=1 Tax=Tropicimonas sp. S265A TaxID=3415134 RepID=UPI003C7BECA4